MTFQPPTSIAEGGVATVTADDASIVVAGTADDPTIRTATLDVIAGLHPPAAAWSNNSKKITGLANGAAASDAAAFGQIPTAFPPSGAAGGVLDGTYPSPGLAAAVAGAGLSEAADVLAVNVDGSTVEISADALRVKALGITGAELAALAVTDAKVAAANKDGAAATASMRTLGTGAAQACAGNDARLSDSRAPSGVAGGDLNGTYPNPLVDGALFGVVAWTVVTKAGDESVASSTTVQADDELKWTAASGAFYEVELYVIYASPAGAGTPNIKTTIAEDATVRGGGRWLGFNPAGTFTQGATPWNTVNTGVQGTAAANRAVIWQGWYVGGGGTAGLYWAQNTSDANATIVRAGSILRYRRIL